MLFNSTKLIPRAIIVVTLLLPIVTFAAPANLDELVKLVVGYMLQAIPIIVLLIFLFFVYGIADFIRKSGKGDDIAEAKKRIVWGVVALFVTFSFWGIVQLLTSDFFGEKPGFIAPQIDSDEVLRQFPRNDAQKTN